MMLLVAAAVSEAVDVGDGDEIWLPLESPVTTISVRGKSLVGWVAPEWSRVGRVLAASGVRSAARESIFWRLGFREPRVVGPSAAAAGWWW